MDNWQLVLNRYVETENVPERNEGIAKNKIETFYLESKRTTS